MLFLEKYILMLYTIPLERHTLKEHFSVENINNSFFTISV